MRPFRVLFLVLLPILLLAGGPVSAVARQAADYVILTTDWEPYVSRGMEGHGLSGEIVMAALKAAGIQAELRFTTRAGMDEQVRKGEAVAAFPLSRSNERKRYMVPTEPLLNLRYIFFYRKDLIGHFRYLSLEDLKPFRVTARHGFFYMGEFSQAGIEVQRAGSGQNALQRLMLGATDIVPENEITGWSFLKSLYPHDTARIACTENALVEYPMYMMVSKLAPGAREFHQAFNRGLEIIRGNGVYGKILSRYVPPEGCSAP